jgi:hypothetical protein
MKKIFSFMIIVLLIHPCFSGTAHAQDVYTTTGGELLFQSGTIEKAGAHVNTDLRFTLFFHVNEYVHFDIGNYVGFYTGIGVRNVGFITEENEIKTKFRSYMLGAPLAIKLGSFKDRFYIFGGGEYEWMFQCKQKTFIDGQKIKYYLKDFINHEYQGSGNYSDYTDYTKTQVWYISLSIQIRNSDVKEFPESTEQWAKL